MDALLSFKNYLVESQLFNSFRAQLKTHSQSPAFGGNIRLMHGRNASNPFTIGDQVLVFSIMIVLFPTAAARCATAVDGAITPVNAVHIAPSFSKSFFRSMSESLIKETLNCSLKNLMSSMSSSYCKLRKQILGVVRIRSHRCRGGYKC